MTVFLLKIIAMTTMLIDHLTACFIPKESFLYLLGRGIGRLAFPIFCFLVIEGFYYTRSRVKYCIRLLLAAVISEIPFDIFLMHRAFDWNKQNVIWTLLLGFLTVWMIDSLKKSYYPFRNFRYIFYSSVAMIAASLLAEAIGSDYGMFGVLLLVMLYYFRGYKRYIQAIVFIVLCLGCYGLSGMLELLGALIFVLLIWYKGEKGRNDKYLFYAFYPAHLLILGLLSMFIFV